MSKQGVSVAEEAAIRGADIMAGIAQEWLAEQSHNTCDEYAVRCWLSSNLKKTAPRSNLEWVLKKAIADMEETKSDLAYAIRDAKEVLDG